MRIARLVLTGLGAGLVLALAACSGGDGSEFGNGNGNGNGSNNGPNNPDPGNNSFSGDDGGVNAACATSSAQAERVPVYLVFMIDRSGSMSQNQKWPTIVAGLETFFNDPASSGLYASVQFFKSPNECDVASYQTPAVAMTGLPSPMFKATIDTYAPNGGTPTRPALSGAILYAQQQQQAHAGSKVAVVLATDGIPNDCNSDVNNVSATAASVASTIPTYVIGVGDQLQSLDTIAMGGGTTKAFVVSVGNPAQTATDFQNALNVIRGNSLSCNFQLPTPPMGRQLDTNSVNVVYTPTGGAANTLTYNQSCMGGTGWHYDNPSAPSNIVLCGDTCNTVQADHGGKVEVVTGCKTVGTIPR